MAQGRGIKKRNGGKTKKNKKARLNQGKSRSKMFSYVLEGVDHFKTRCVLLGFESIHCIHLKHNNRKPTAIKIN